MHKSLLQNSKGLCKEFGALGDFQFAGHSIPKLHPASRRDECDSLRFGWGVLGASDHGL